MVMRQFAKNIIPKLDKTSEGHKNVVLVIGVSDAQWIRIA